MQDYGLVSIITPNYNCERFIAQTIESVQAQTYQNWELLIQDDCSTDESVGIALKYMEKDSRIKIAQNCGNCGAAVSRNQALRSAKGKWIAFLDSDDLWAPNKLEKQLKFMVENDYHFSYTCRDVIDEDSKEIGKLISGPKRIGVIGMYCFCWVGCLSVIYDAEEVGVIQIVDIKKNNDYAIWLKVIKKCDCYLLEENLAHYRVRKGSISNHSYFKLIRWHYWLFRDSERFNPIFAFLMTAVNIVFGLVKKIHYTKRYSITR